MTCIKQSVKQHDVKPRKVFRDVQSWLKGVTTPIAGGSFDDPIEIDDDSPHQVRPTPSSSSGKNQLVSILSPSCHPSHQC
jgi:hypothetical protein